MDKLIIHVDMAMSLSPLVSGFEPLLHIGEAAFEAGERRSGAGGIGDSDGEETRNEAGTVGEEAESETGKRFECTVGTFLEQFITVGKDGDSEKGKKFKCTVAQISINRT